MSKRKEDSTEQADDEEEEDYMSNDFLHQIVDKRPGLVFNRTLAHKYEVEKKSKQKIEENNLKTVSTKKLEAINREETLKKSLLNESNKGFNLMLKMGYEKGQGLGCRTSTSTKLIEPISVEIKTDRGGLGQNEEKKRKFQEYARTKEDQNKTEKQLADAYLDSKRHLFLIRRLRGDLFKCQKVCYQLDSSREIHKPGIALWHLTFFCGYLKIYLINFIYFYVDRYWPYHIVKAISQKDNSEIKPNLANSTITTSTDSKIEPYSSSTSSEFLLSKEETRQLVDLKSVYDNRLNSFLREETNSSSDKEISKEENDEENNRFNTCCDINKEKDNSELESDNEENEELTEEVITKRIETISLYLRQTYFYCVWCTVKYENNEILVNSCPGIYKYLT